MELRPKKVRKRNRKKTVGSQQYAVGNDKPVGSMQYAEGKNDIKDALPIAYRQLPTSIVVGLEGAAGVRADKRPGQCKLAADPRLQRALRGTLHLPAD